MAEYPYSDNMYSGLDDSDAEEADDLYTVAAGLGLGDSSYRPGGQSEQQQHHHQHSEEEEVLSPSDGYFGRSAPQSGASARTAYPSDHYTAPHPQRQHHDDVPLSTSSPASVPRASQVPHVPDVWVSDPSLSQGSNDKANEAQEERNQYRNARQFAAADQDRLDSTLGISSLTSPAATGTTTSSNSNNNSNNHILSPSSPQQQQPVGARTSTAASPASSSSPSAAVHRYTPSHTSSPSAAGPSHYPRRLYSERSLLFGDAPPAYTPSPTSPTSNASGRGTFGNYQTFPPTSPTTPPGTGTGTGTGMMGRLSESESHGLLAGQTYNAIPQSMGGDLHPNDDGHYEYPRPDGWRDRLRQFSWRRHWKLVLLGIVLTFVTLGFLVSSVLGVKNERTIQFPDNPDNRPVTSPGEKAPGEKTPGQKIPFVDDDGTRLRYPSYDEDPFANFNTRQCGDNKIQYNRMVLELDFSPSRNVSIFQNIKDDDQTHQGKDVRVQGEVVVRRSGEGTPAPSVVLETASNDDGIAYTLNWDDGEQRLYLLTPRSMPWSERTTSPCLSIRATVWTPPRSALASLNIESVHLGIHLLDNLSLRLGEFARLASTVGPVISATDGEKDKHTLMREPPPSSFALDSRYIEVKTMSAAISGSWPLYDYLGLETISGTIQAGVTPKEALKEKPRPAILYAHSVSGTIEVFEPIAAAAATWAAQQTADSSSSSSSSSSMVSAEKIIPARQYGVDLYSMSGTIKANVAFGSSCKVHTTSGSVDLALLPVLDRAQADVASAEGSTTSFLETTTTSGTTRINVLEPLWGNLQSGSYMMALADGAPPTVPAGIAPTLPRGRRGVVGGQIDDRDPYDLVGRIDSPAAAAAAAGSSNRALRVLNGRHTATSATIHVAYPASWEGWIDGDSMSGRITVAGEGVQIIRQGQDSPGIKRHTLAHKGEEGKGGNLKVHTTSGDIGVLIGS